VYDTLEARNSNNKNKIRKQGEKKGEGHVGTGINSGPYHMANGNMERNEGREGSGTLASSEGWAGHQEANNQKEDDQVEPTLNYA